MVTAIDARFPNQTEYATFRGIPEAARRRFPAASSADAANALVAGPKNKGFEIPTLFQV
jgi:hypothetical protein